MISTNIILKNKNTKLHIHTKEETKCLRTYCTIESTLNQTQLKNSFVCNKDISLLKYRQILNIEVTPMIKDFETLMQEV